MEKPKQKRELSPEAIEKMRAGGRKGGQVKGVAKGFASPHQDPVAAGQLGGKISRRGKHVKE